MHQSSGCGRSALAEAARRILPVLVRPHTGERWAEPEIHRLFGDILARRGPSDASIANYERAIAVARAQGSRSFELRATTSLARALSGQGRHAEAHVRLLNIYRFFNGGCDAADLVDAKALLDELPSASRRRAQ